MKALLHSASFIHRFLSYIITLSLLLSCSSEKPADIAERGTSGADSYALSKDSRSSVSPTDIPYSLEITPATASGNSTLYLIAGGFKLSDAKVEWLVNGNPVRNPLQNQFRQSGIKKGDTVQAKATIGEKEILSDIVRIKNATPEISYVKVLPEVFKPGDNLYVDVTGSDIDGDEVTILYEWTKNGEPAGNNRQIGLPLKRGDKVSVRITPFDREIYGRPIVLHREIRNMPPIIIEDKDYDLYRNVYTYQVKATDPDGDSLTFSLKSSPTGMVIDSSTGLIRWDVPPGTRGRQSITVAVFDGHGGEAVQSFTFEITPLTPFSP